MSEKRAYCNIISKKDDKAIVLINGSIYPWGDNSSKNMINAIQELDAKFSEVTFLINSPGGDVAEGVAIYNEIQAMKANTIGIVVGIAASIAGVILQACDKRGARKMTMFMTHKFAVRGTSGSAKKLRETAEMMESWESEIVDEFAKRTKQPKKTVKGWFAEGVDKYFNVTQMKSNGLIDFIDTSGKSEQAPEDMNEDAGALYNFFVESITNELEIPKSKNKTTKMKKEHLEIIGLSEEASDSDIKNRLKELKNEAKTVKNAKKQLKKHAKAVVKNAIKAGKISAGSKDYAIEQYLDDPEGFENMLGGMAVAAKPSQVIDLASKGGKKKKEGNKDRENWTLDNFLEKDPEALDNMSDKEYQKRFGKSETSEDDE